MSAITPSASSGTEGYSAFTNALKMGGSILVSWGIALGVRLVLPRLLGPDRFGEFNFSDAFASVFFLAMAFGIDTWIRKEVGVTLANANAFFGGVLVLRFAMAVVLNGLTVIALRLLHRGVEVQLTVVVFGFAQLFLYTNAALAALLHSIGRVDGLLLINIVGKLVWGLLLMTFLLTHASLPFLASALAVSEGVKAAATWVLASKHAGLKFHFDPAATRKMLKASLPFYVTSLALGAMGRTDTAILGTMINDTEVGWYGSVMGFFGLAMVLSPLISWVLMPLLARAAARSADELDRLTRRALEGCLSAAIPMAMCVGLGAEVFVRLLYGEKFAPAAMALRVIAPAFALTYLNIVSSICLTALNRGWSVTLTSVLSLVLSPMLNLALIPVFSKWLGPAGGATACAFSLVTTELITTSIMLFRIGRRAVDARTVVMVTKTLAVCAGCVAVDLGLRQLGMHQVLRLLIEATLYVGGVIATRAVRPKELVELVKTARAQRTGVPT